MINIVLNGIILFAMGVLAFYAVVALIKLWYGCTDKEAIARLRAWTNGKPAPGLDLSYVDNTIWEKIRQIIGEKRYNQHYVLNTTLQDGNKLFRSGLLGGLPCIQVAVYYANDNEKHILESIIEGELKKSLTKNKYKATTIGDWKMRYDLNMPYYEVRYSTNPNQASILAYEIQNRQQNIINSNVPMTDEEDEEIGE